MRLKFRNGMSVAIIRMALLCVFATHAEKITLTIDHDMPQLQTQVFQVEAGEANGRNIFSDQQMMRLMGIV